MPVGYLVNVGLLGFRTAVVLPAHTAPSHRSYWATFQIHEQPFAAFYLADTAGGPGWPAA